MGQTKAGMGAMAARGQPGCGEGESGCLRPSLPGPALDSPCFGVRRGWGSGKLLYLRVRGRSLPALGSGDVLWDVGVVDQGGYCRGSRRILSFEPTGHFPLGILGKHGFVRF